MNSKAVLVVSVVLIAALAFFLFSPELDISSIGIGGRHAVEFNVTISLTGYEPNSISVSQGDLVRIKAVAAPGFSSFNLGITIDEYNINEVVGSETVPKVIEFTAKKPGVIQAYCGPCDQGPFGREHPDIRMTVVVN